ncbi:MAG: hypothetical protein Q8J84_04235 [Flavobacteriaceae bacterium]|nr:hypothetical protein [Flavobacteriaceae bacterium]
MYRSFLIITGLLISITSCSGVKKTQSELHAGNYDKAIDVAVYNLKTNKNKKSKQDYVVLLEEAFVKAVERDENRLKLLKGDTNPVYSQEIFDIYINLDQRQEKIRPLLPLKIVNSNRNAKFVFKDYSSEIIQSKKQLTGYLYSNSLRLLASNQKENARLAYQDLFYLNKINPNFKDVSQLLEEAHFKGTNFIFVQLMNDTPFAIPHRLEDDLLNFNTYGLNDFWTVYHRQKTENILYNMQLLIRFTSIEVSPEQLKERIIIKEKEVKDGFTYLKDKNGNVKKDSLGNDIKMDKFKTVRSTVIEITQFKTAKVVAKVDYFDTRNQQLINSFPVASEFIFKHQFATFKGDKRALESPYIDWINRKFIPFPSSEQMIFDTGEDLKQKIKAILKNQNF